jgi:hypothetical protein
MVQLPLRMNRNVTVAQAMANNIREMPNADGLI